MHGWTKGAHLIIEWRRDEEEPSGEWVEGEGWLARLLPIREELERGDYRALYLGWLHAASCNEFPEETLEQLVPAGLGKLTAAQRSLVEFLDIDEDLLTAAAQDSPSAVDRTDSPDAMAQWVAAVPAEEAQQIASAYDRARDLLVDLSDAHKLTHDHDTFLKKIAQLRKANSRRSALLRRLDQAGLRASA